MNESLLTQNTTPDRHITDSVDFYKFPMTQIAFEKFPNEEVTFTLKNRSTEFPLSQYVDTTALRARFEEIAQKGFTPEEIAYLAGMKNQANEASFTEDYLDFLADLELPEVNVSINKETGELAINSTGPWPNVSFWETVVMSEVNEMYYKNLLEAQGTSVEEAWAEGDRRLDEKIAILKDRPDIKFADFGTRRRFSAGWHDHVVGRLANELPESFIGSSNPWFAYKYGVTAIGTYAHEMPMVYAAMARARGEDPMVGHAEMVTDWEERYEDNYSTALTDTFTSKFFFAEFTEAQAKHWRGLRHDSGDPIEFGEQVLQFYEEYGVDPTTKTIVFSDGLDIETIVQLADHFQGRINIVFGWGTTLMNDLGFRANNFVMKATRVNGTETVKLSDNEGKHTGSIEEIELYANSAAAHILAHLAMKETVTL